MLRQVIKSVMLFILFFIANIFALDATEQGSWIGRTKLDQPITLEWYAFKEVDAVVQERVLQCLPVYARAMAPFQVSQIEAFRNLPYEEQEKKVKYQNYPSDFDIDNCYSFLVADLIDEFQEEMEADSEKDPSALNQKYLVIVKDGHGEVLGFTFFGLNEEHPEIGAELEPIMIDPSAQGLGIARQLVFSILKLRPDVQRIYLATNAQNVKAHPIYEHFGFKESARVKTDTIAWPYGVAIIYEFLTNEATATAMR